MKKLENLVYRPFLILYTIFAIILSYFSMLWRLDPHHDGIGYLQAKLSEQGNYPPKSIRTFYGIAQPAIEGNIIKLFPNNFLFYRLIALVLIFTTAYLIYKICLLYSDKYFSALIALVWFMANPTFANSINNIPISIQTSWPNLWIQSLSLLAIFMILQKSGINLWNQILVGVIAGTLPFFRIQGLITSILLLTLCIVNLRRHIRTVLISFCASVFSWLLLVVANGGLVLYYYNIILNAKDGFNSYTTLNYATKFATGFINYYLIVGLLFVLIVFLSLKMSKGARTRSKQTTYIFLFIPLLLSLLMSKNFHIWPSVLYRNSSTLIIDSTILISLLYLIINWRKIVKNKNFPWEAEELNIIILAIGVLANLVYQYPLPDLGHRWWSSSLSLIFISQLMNKSWNRITIEIKIIFKNSFVFLSVATILLSSVQGLFFLNIDKKTIHDNNLFIFNGVQYASSNEEVIQNLFKSIKVLRYLEEKQVAVNYYCRDGLYYVRNNGYVESSKNALNFLNTKGALREYVGVNFYCNTNIKDISYIKDKHILLIGNSQTDFFIFNDNDFKIFNELNYMLANS